MSWQFIDANSSFPDINTATPEGIVAIGGDLSVNRLLEAYSGGIFPWFTSSEPIIWWSPNPRFVIMKSDFHISKSLKKILKRNQYRITINKAFREVIKACSREDEPREEQWLHDEMIEAYCRMFDLGKAVSVEAWDNEGLAGGLYGVITGSVFSGESMFSRKKNASKAALATFGTNLFANGFTMIDCQIYSEHLETFGGTDIQRSEFIKHLSPPYLQVPELQITK